MRERRPGESSSSRGGYDKRRGKAPQKKKKDGDNACPIENKAMVQRSQNRLYLLDLKVEQPVCLAVRHIEEPWLWHVRFGHLSFDVLGRLRKMVRGLPHIEHAGDLFNSCLTGKQRRLPFPKATKYRAANVLELVHGDLCGPITPAMHGGRRYFLLLVDDCSRFMWLQLLTSKDRAAEAIKRFQARAEAESGKGGAPSHCAVLTATERHSRAAESDRSGHGTKYDEGKGHASRVLGRGCENEDIHPQPCADEGPEGMTPFEAWHSRQPDVSFPRTFGCIGHVKKPKPFLSKLEDRNTPMVFLGYEEESKGYRLYDPRGGKVVVSRDVVFDEMAAWGWENPGTREARGISGTFVIEHLVIHGGGDAGAEEPAADAPSPAAVATSVEPQSPAMAARAKSLHQRLRTRPHQSPLLRQDTEHLQRQQLSSPLLQATSTSLASRLLDDQELLFVSAEEPFLRRPSAMSVGDELC
ncbi:Unknown protein [Striga hermonthica]|uniref:GAG-pre-integrase domain-containing protein n=1 Tax=Striga hermonthica TaxID=68872 RepID=A0A9N7MUE2_STRHE|nr:Unknown protein [Striga hermonthica]